MIFLLFPIFYLNLSKKSSFRTVFSAPFLFFRQKKPYAQRRIRFDFYHKSPVIPSEAKDPTNAVRRFPLGFFGLRPVPSKFPQSLYFAVIFSTEARQSLSEFISASLSGLLLSRASVRASSSVSRRSPALIFSARSFSISVSA